MFRGRMPPARLTPRTPGRSPCLLCPELDKVFTFYTIVVSYVEESLTETEVLAHLLEHRKTSARELTQRFSGTILSAHQALLRLGRKGLVEKEKVGNRVEFRLTDKAGALSRKVKENDQDLPLVLLLGLAASILLRASREGGENDEAH